MAFNDIQIETKITPLKQTGPLDGFKILVVDDCEENRYLFKHLLSRRGATVDVAEDGLEGVNSALASYYDLLLMDIQMPVMDGFAALEELKLQNCSTSVVALTAQSKEEERTKIVNAGFVAHVTKPVDVGHFIDLIQKIVNEKK